jgi:hypothetical protein
MPDRVDFHDKFSSVRSAKAIRRSDRVAYFEIRIVELYFLQIGFLTFTSDTTQSLDLNQSSVSNDGVGENETGWGWDGVRNCFWNQGNREDVSRVEWMEGSVLGFLCDFDRNIASLFQDGQLTHSFVFSSEIQSLVPVCTGYGSSIRIYWRNGFENLPTEAIFPNCIMCDSRHVCQPCVHILEDNEVRQCSVCGMSVETGSYGLQCKPCSFWCCSYCDAASSVFFVTKAPMRLEEPIRKGSCKEIQYSRCVIFWV